MNSGPDSEPVFLQHPRVESSAAEERAARRGGPTYLRRRVAPESLQVGGDLRPVHVWQATEGRSLWQARQPPSDFLRVSRARCAESAAPGPPSPTAGFADQHSFGV